MLMFLLNSWLTYVAVAAVVVAVCFPIMWLRQKIRERPQPDPTPVAPQRSILRSGR